MDQTRLFELAVESLTLGAVFVHGEGWHLKVAIRRQGDHWGPDPWVHYDHLTTAELADVIDAVVAAGLLGL